MERKRGGVLGVTGECSSSQVTEDNEAWSSLVFAVQANRWSPHFESSRTTQRYMVATKTKWKHCKSRSCWGMQTNSVHTTEVAKVYVNMNFDIRWWMLMFVAWHYSVARGSSREQQNLSSRVQSYICQWIFNKLLSKFLRKICNVTKIKQEKNHCMDLTVSKLEGRDIREMLSKTRY